MSAQASGAMTVGRCFRDRAEVFIFLDNSAQMFRTPMGDGATAMGRAQDFLKPLLAYIQNVPELNETVKLFIGNKKINTQNGPIFDQFVNAIPSIHIGPLLPYTILRRKLRGESMKTVRIIVLTTTHFVPPPALGRRTMILEFDVSSFRPFQNITFVTVNAHVREEDVEKAAHQVFITNVLPYNMTVISGAHPVLGHVYARMTTVRKTHANQNSVKLPDGSTLEPMTVPEIILIGIGRKEEFEQLRQCGIGIFETWSRRFNYGMRDYLQNGVGELDETLEELQISQATLSDNMTGLLEVAASLRQNTQQEYWLIGWCKEMCSKRQMLVVLWPPIEERTSNGQSTENDWTQSQDVLSEWDTCTSRVHGAVTLNDAKVRVHRNKQNRQNWMAGSNCIRLSFHDWPDFDILRTPDFIPNEGVSLHANIAYSQPIVTNFVLMKHLLKFCYIHENAGKPFKFFNSCKGMRYNEHTESMVQTLCEDVHRECRNASGSGRFDGNEDSTEFFNLVVSQISSGH